MTEVYAYVDESMRSGVYLLGCVVIAGQQVGSVRTDVRRLLLPGERRLHFQDEGNRRRRQLLAEMSRMAIAPIIYVRSRRDGLGAEQARAACLGAAVRDLQARSESARLVVESRSEADRFDLATVVAARRPVPPLTFEHLPPHADPLLWLPDAFAWAFGAGGEWRRRVRTMAEICNLS